MSAKLTTDELVNAIQAHGRKDFSALGLFFAELDKEVAYHWNMTYTGHSIKRQGDGWLIVLNAREKSTHKVMFIGGATLLEAYRRLFIAVVKGGGTWAIDKYRNG